MTAPSPHCPPGFWCLCMASRIKYISPVVGGLWPPPCTEPLGMRGALCTQAGCPLGPEGEEVHVAGKGGCAALLRSEMEVVCLLRRAIPACPRLRGWQQGLQQVLLPVTLCHGPVRPAACKHRVRWGARLQTTCWYVPCSGH